MREIKIISNSRFKCVHRRLTNKKEGKVFYYKKGIRRRGIELLESFLVLSPTNV